MNNDKKLGQHWLTHQPSLEAMLMAGVVEPGDEILEVGPGLGALTELLLMRGACVTAVEYDERLVKGLDEKYGSQKFKLVQGDILQFNLTTMPTGYKVVANIPYYLTSKLLRNLLENENKPSIIALLVQKEVAERIAASPGQMSILGISAQYYAEVELKEVVLAEHFEPSPKVDSQIIVLRIREKPIIDVDRANFFRMVKAGFSEKRKKLTNSLSSGLVIDKESVAEDIADIGLDGNIRAQELSLKDWEKLYNKLYN